MSVSNLGLRSSVCSYLSLCSPEIDTWSRVNSTCSLRKSWTRWSTARRTASTNPHAHTQKGKKKKKKTGLLLFVSAFSQQAFSFQWRTPWTVFLRTYSCICDKDQGFLLQTSSFNWFFRPDHRYYMLYLVCPMMEVDLPNRTWYTANGLWSLKGVTVKGSSSLWPTTFLCISVFLA